MVRSGAIGFNPGLRRTREGCVFSSPFVSRLEFSFFFFTHLKIRFLFLGTVEVAHQSPRSGELFLNLLDLRRAETG